MFNMRCIGRRSMAQHKDHSIHNLYRYLGKLQFRELVRHSDGS
jgi:hypothetical protein